MAGQSAEIIVGSIRLPSNVLEAQVAGAHFVTVGTKVLKEMAIHPGTDKSVQGF